MIEERIKELVEKFDKEEAAMTASGLTKSDLAWLRGFEPKDVKSKH